MKIISLNRDELLADLRSIAQQMSAGHPEISSIRLFGSLARGDQTGLSDVDILVVLHGAPSVNPLLAMREYLGAFYQAADQLGLDVTIGIDLLTLSLADVEKRLAENEAWMRTIWGESFELMKQ